MTDDLSLSLLISSFWLVPFLVSILVGRAVSARGAIIVALALACLLSIGAFAMSLDDRGYGREFALIMYAGFVVAPTFVSTLIGLVIGRSWKRRAEKS